ncbi:MAG: division/cell wall cluster transcriptional repressor MraZ [Bacteroidota bacterium]|nr:division/cell wall cluster transcriptional repressor MraZ [Bacteroidota bacterium]
MGGFKGQATYSVDSKGRAAIPAKMRQVLLPEDQKTFTVVRGFDQCILAYPLSVWRKQEAEISALSIYNPDHRDFIRLMLSQAEEVTMDSQSRVMLPKPLVEFAGVKDRVLIIGALRWLEFWDPATYDAHIAERAADFQTLARTVMGDS